MTYMADLYYWVIYGILLYCRVKLNYLKKKKKKSKDSLMSFSSGKLLSFWLNLHLFTFKVCTAWKANRAKV